MPKKATKYWVMTKDETGLVKKHLLSVHDDNKVSASKYAIMQVRLGGAVKAQVIYKPKDSIYATGLQEARPVISFFTKDGAVWFKQGTNTGPVTDDGPSFPGGVFLND